MSTENIKRGGMLSVRAEGDQAEVKIEGTKINCLYNLATLSIKVADAMNMPLEVLLMMVEGTANLVKEEIQAETRMDTGAIERMIGRGGNQKN